MKWNKHKIQWILDREDQSRFDYQGGYPCQWEIIENALVIASLDHDNAPVLNIYRSMKDLEDEYFDWNEESREEYKKVNWSGYASLFEKYTKG